MKLVSESICTTQSQVAKQISPSNNNYIQAVAVDNYEKQAINNIFDSLMLNATHKMWPSDTPYPEASTEVSLTKKTFALRTHISRVDLLLVIIIYLCIAMQQVVLNFQNNAVTHEMFEMNWRKLKYNILLLSFTHSASRLQH